MYEIDSSLGGDKTPLYRHAGVGEGSKVKTFAFTKRRLISVCPIDVGGALVGGALVGGGEGVLSGLASTDKTNCKQAPIFLFPSRALRSLRCRLNIQCTFVFMYAALRQSCSKKIQQP